ncbi:F0F1 ATP synthase subunit B [Halocynthiibacter namhaensis]|uniref:F0F1 ATP synthase subunit B n=1 Tax=Halocynthiibacter namhaensis TaxID=1290553 RepID=UPI000579789D|nr:F0F1 ATP synthase subunit B [Halocynthiibacter namhaensis]
MKKLTVLFALAATPAFAAGDIPFFSLFNTNFVVLLAFIAFIAVLVVAKVPGMLGGQLDARAEGIRSELDEARALREEAQTLLASYERKQEEVKEQATRIVAHAKMEAEEAAELAKEDLKSSIARRLQAAEDQISSAKNAAVKEVRDRAVTVAVGAASDLIAKKMTAAEGNSLIDAAIVEAEQRLN